MARPPVIDTPPAAEPLTLAEVKEHLVVTGTADDALLDDYIKAAREYSETITQLAWITRTLTETYDDWPSLEFRLRQNPVQSVTSIKYDDVNGTEQTLAATVYVLDVTNKPARIRLAYNQSWPSLYSEINNVRIKYKAGYGDASTSMPQAARTAMQFLIAHWYRVREPVAFGVNPVAVPDTFHDLLASLRILEVSD